MSAPTPSISINDVTKRFGLVEAVRDLNLAIGSAEFFTLLGPSGCGKTTTLRMIAGFEDPTKGNILIDGEPVGGLPPDQRPTNTVFQSYALFPHLSVGENVAFGLRRKGVSKDEVKRRVHAELERVGLAGEIGRRPSQLSGGQQQRVALARALVNMPKVLLLDEPLGALDLKLRRQLQLELKRIQQEVGITFVYVTHDQEEALTMSDRIAVMNAGRLEQVGSPEEIYERPSTTFVADFIGVSNLVPPELVGVTGRGAKFAVIRPEKLRIAPARARGPGIEGVVSACVYLGSATQVVVRVDGELEMKVLMSSSDDPAPDIPAAGARVRLSWSSEHVHLVREPLGDPVRA